MRLSPPLASILVLAALGGCSACTSSAPIPRAPRSLAPPEGELLSAELSTVGWDASSGAPVVLLREHVSGQVLPIWIGVAEARAILQALHGIEPPRPQTHDLMARLLEHLGATLEEVVVTELRDGTYYGLLKLHLDGEKTPRWIDTRPSDGLALALRTGARIRIAAALVENQGDFQFLAPEVSEQVVRVLGLTVRAATPELREELGLPDRDGLVVVAVAGEAERRGLEPGDLVVDVNGKAPKKPLDLLDAIRGVPESVLTLTYWRDGKEKTVELEVEIDLPQSPRQRGKIA